MIGDREPEIDWKGTENQRKVGRGQRTRARMQKNREPEKGWKGIENQR